MSPTAYDLKARRDALLVEAPKLRARDLANRLGISEAELVALGAAGTRTTRLAADWPGIIAAIGSLGRVMALTRNESCVHERKGIYGKLEGNAHVGLIVGEDIDLRIFFQHWQFGFAVTEGEKRSLQFFDGHGRAIHKIYLTADSNIEAYEQLVRDWADDEMEMTMLPSIARPAALPDYAIDVAGFQAAWDNLRDTHQFFGLLNKFKLERVQALRLAGEARAARVGAATLRDALGAATETQTPIMVFVGNPGIIQIHTGPITNLKTMGLWFNVLDPDFNLHLREDQIASAWIVRKPTDDCFVTSLELFDEDGETIAMIFGKRKPGQREDAAWRDIVSSLHTRVAA